MNALMSQALGTPEAAPEAALALGASLCEIGSAEEVKRGLLLMERALELMPEVRGLSFRLLVEVPEAGDLCQSYSF